MKVRRLLGMLGKALGAVAIAAALIALYHIITDNYESYSTAATIAVMSEILAIYLYND